MKLETILKNYNIDFIDTGKNVKKGEINICCPFCKQEKNEDTNFHLAINPRNLIWMCWRNKRHKGKGLTKLLVTGLKLNYEDVLSLTREEIKDRETLIDKTVTKIEEPILNLDFFAEFKSIKDEGITARFYEYLEGRGLLAKTVIEHYRLKACLMGPWRNRIIIPYYENDFLITWTGRTIHETELLRYLDLSSAKGACMGVKQCLFDYDNLTRGGDTLFICEGQFDAIKLGCYLGNTNRATCLGTKTITMRQANLLNSIGPLFNTVVLMLDYDAQVGQIVEELNLDNLSIYPLTGVKDPGELTCQQIKEIEKLYA